MTAVVASTGERRPRRRQHATRGRRGAQEAVGPRHPRAGRGREPRPPQKANDSFYLRRLYPGFLPRDQSGSTAREDALDKHDLRQYSTIFLVNVPRLTEIAGEEPGAVHRRGRRRRRLPRPEGRSGRLQQADVPRRRRLLPRARCRSKPTKPLTEDEKDNRAFSPSTILLRDSVGQDAPGPLRHLHQRARRPDQGQRHRALLLLRATSTSTGRSRGWASGARTSRFRSCTACRTRHRSEFMERGSNALMQGVTSKYGEPKFEKYRAAVNELLDEDSRHCLGPTGTPLTDPRAQFDRLLADQMNDGDAERGAASASSGASPRWPSQGAWPRRFATRPSTATRSTSPRRSATAASR